MCFQRFLFVELDVFNIYASYTDIWLEQCTLTDNYLSVCCSIWHRCQSTV